jgi:hypothetical protein
MHTGSYYAKDQVDKAAKQAGKEITTVRWKVRDIENRKYYRNQSEVLWPAVGEWLTFEEVSAALEQGQACLSAQMERQSPRA